MIVLGVNWWFFLFSFYLLFVILIDLREWKDVKVHQMGVPPRGGGGVWRLCGFFFLHYLIESWLWSHYGFHCDCNTIGSSCYGTLWLHGSLPYRSIDCSSIIRLLFFSVLILAIDEFGDVLYNIGLYSSAFNEESISSVFIVHLCI